MKELLKKALERNQETKERLDKIEFSNKDYDQERNERLLNWILENH